MIRLRTFINTMMALTMIAMAIAILIWQRMSFSSEILFSVSLIFSFIGGIFLWVHISDAPTPVFQVLYGLAALSLNIIAILMMVYFIPQGIPWFILGIIFGILSLISLAISYFCS